MIQATCRTIGEGDHRVLVIDHVDADIAAVVAIAAALAPFPPASGVAYPGLRRTITPRDLAAEVSAETSVSSKVKEQGLSISMRRVLGVANAMIWSAVAPEG